MLLDDISGVEASARETMMPYWENIMRGDSGSSSGGDEAQPAIDGLWDPVSAQEIRKTLPASTTSSGPDGLSARLLRRIPLGILVRILNIIIWCGKAPTYLLESVTSLIPKKANAGLPSDFLSVSSVLIRTLHKVLAIRMADKIKLDQRQRAFKPTDRCSDSVFLLDLVLRYHHCHKPLFMASLDIAKAFDSVSHSTI